jgi:hypothetical protein
MQLTEIEKLKTKQLRQRVDEAFAKSDEKGPGYLAEAQFYMRELEHRRDLWVSRRDLFLEMVVIALIGWEIHMGYQQQTHQDEAFEKEKTIWEHMDTSTKATADTLSSLAGTSDAMNKALQKQLALFYDISVSTTYSSTDKRLTITNMGRTNVIIGGIKIANVVAVMIPEGRVVTPQSTYNVELAATLAYDYIVQQAAQDKDGLTPFDVYVRNERREEFVIHSYFIVKDKAITNVQEGAITPEHWSGKKK